VIAELVATAADSTDKPRYLHIPVVAMQTIRQSIADLSLSDAESIASLLEWPVAA
jgi:hypothetical protein